MKKQNKNYLARALRQRMLPEYKSRYRLTLSLLLVVLTIVYVGLTNSVATQGYQLATLEKEVHQLEKINSDFTLNLAAAESLRRVEAAASALAFTNVSKVKYVGTITSVASR